MKSFTHYIKESQKFTSAATSINKSKLPKGYSAVGKHFGWKKGSTHIDIGGGRFDNAIEHLAKHGVTGHVYDPYNRSPEHNENVIKSVGGKADTASLFNVLNVIQEPEHHVTALRKAHESLRPGGRVFIGVYEGDKSGKGKQTGKDSYQRNERLGAYLDTVKQVFPNATIRGGIIHATKEE